MPIHCPITLPRLSSHEFAELDYAVMAHAFATHRELGRLADETIYQADFAAHLGSAGLASQREVPVTVSFRSFTRLDHRDAP
ncbi:MAG: GxxExxY protein [Prosthecobacter sp.]|nr:GxxExxY protein [Prosthecobacter sp.]